MEGVTITILEAVVVGIMVDDVVIVVLVVVVVDVVVVVVLMVVVMVEVLVVVIDNIGNVDDIVASLSMNVVVSSIWFMYSLSVCDIWVVVKSSVWTV